MKIMVIRLEVWVVLIRISLTRCIWLVHIVKTGLKLSKTNGVGVRYGFILGLKELLLLNSISHTITNKKEKSNNKQKERKCQNQAYTKIDLDLDLSLIHI